MSTTSQPHVSPPWFSAAGFRKFTPAEYHKLIDSGIIMEGEPIELLEGYLVEKHVRNPPHEAALRRLTARLQQHVPGWFVQVQGAIALGGSEPEPDGALIRGDETTCDGRLPTATDLGLVIEVSDSSLAFDRREKGHVYSRVGIPVYWIINVANMQIEVYMDPENSNVPAAYLTRIDYKPGDQLPIILDGKQAATIPVSDLLP